MDLTGSGAGGSKSPKVRGEKGAASFTSIADAADHIATRRGYTRSEGGEWEDSDWGIQAGELAGDWAGSSEDEG